MSSGRHATPFDPAYPRGGRIYEETHGRCSSRADKLDFTQNLFRIWRDFPDIRLGQLIENARVNAAEDHCAATDAFYLEDDALHEALYKFWLEHSKPGKRRLQRLEEAIGRERSAERG